MTETALTSRHASIDRKRRHRPRSGFSGLFVTDQEIYEALGVPEDVARVAIKGLDANPALGFPKKQKLFGDRRYRKAVEQWFDSEYGLKLASQSLRRAS